jgi:CDP-4-dehydro-6-deoxyglucose reductase
MKSSPTCRSSSCRRGEAEARQILQVAVVVLRGIFKRQTHRGPNQSKPGIITHGRPVDHGAALIPGQDKPARVISGLPGASVYCCPSMTDLYFKDRRYSLQPNESALDCLLRNGQAIPYACKAGMCQACLVRAVDCEATAESKKWIKPALQARGYTLACQWFPDGDITCELPGLEDFSIAVTIRELASLNANILKVCLTLDEPSVNFSCKPGHYVSLINPQGIIRPYSVASDLQRDGYLELHIGRTSHGVFTGWLFDNAATGMSLRIRGPAGECTYDPDGDDDYPILLAGNGTGLAPLIGITRDALARDHRGRIRLFHGGRTPAHLYLGATLADLQQQHGNFEYIPCVIDNPEPNTFETGSLEAVIDRHMDRAGAARTRVFLCGTPELVYRLRKIVYLKGVRSENIHCDPFTERTVARTS